MQLSGFDVPAFVRNHWQKQPVLLRSPWKHWVNPLAPDELAGLACEEGIEARLVVQARGAWQVEHGPFPPERFATLGRKPWTLLVNAVDHHAPAVAALLEPFQFIPNWRVDDVMVSYAADGGGVGPHFDQYDVFLIQGSGRRRWQIGEVCDAATALAPHDELRLLANFAPTEEWILEPGDMLYLPPGVPHNGTAIGDDCMTYSIGFRAPTRSELIAHWCDHVLAEVPEDDRYGDPALPAQDNPGEITAEALAKLHDMVLEKLEDRAGFSRWFGEYNTTPKYPDVDWAPSAPFTLDEVEAALCAELPLCRNPASRFSFARTHERAVLLFVDGQSFECDGPVAAFAEAICQHGRLDAGSLVEWGVAVTHLILTLCNRGSVTFDDGTDA